MASNARHAATVLGIRRMTSMIDNTKEVQALREDILENGAAYTFRQLIRLLNGRLRPAANGTPVRIRPALSLELPRSQVASVRRDGENYEITTTFLGLYGVDSPLPAFYTEELIEAAQEDRGAARTLLDAIHQHLYALYIDAQEKHRPLEATVERGDPRFRDLLRSLIGLRDPAVRAALPEPETMLQYVALLGSRQRSAEGLRTLLESLFEGINVAVDQCVERQVRIPALSRVRLGQQSHGLGRNAVIGTHVRDRTGKIRVRIGPLSRERFNALINESKQWQSLVRMIRFYLSTPVECELQLELEPGAASTTVLGEPQHGRLGASTWLFSSEVNNLRATLQL